MRSTPDADNDWQDAGGDSHGPADDRSERLPLKDAVQFALDEARMILPGIQALFGFQLIAVFNERFESGLDMWQRSVHLVALVLVAAACALVMAPAAYHRQAEQGHVSRDMRRRASFFIGAGLVPLMLGICLDVYVVAELVTDHPGWSAAIGFVCFAMFAGLWFVYPWWRRRQHRRHHGDRDFRPSLRARP
jgi:hypothetical protein